ncbi:unnamed protein product [Mytilus coruscus]|uniref:Uncharacterized protein n=1 Tax=Mytilus coruscus TaxID=42192 RepID=A0A6J8CYT8_MYTCO|nr:unnamed protein product [Mytilus coruscus]
MTHMVTSVLRSVFVISHRVGNKHIYGTYKHEQNYSRLLNTSPKTKEIVRQFPSNPVAKSGQIISLFSCDIRRTTSSLPNERVSSNTATGVQNGTSNVEWIIYTICIACCFILTGFGHLFRTCKKRTSIKQKFINEEDALELLESTPYMDHYNEVDKKPLTFVTTVNAPSHEPQTETINFVFHERQSNTTCTVHDEVGYLDLYFVMKEDLNHQEENRSSQNQSLSTSSFNSNFFGQDNTEYFKPYKPLQEYSQEDSQGCEVAVTVHQHIERSSRSEENASSNIYSNVYQLLQKDRQLNSQANGNQLSPVSNTVHDQTLQTAIPSTFRTGNLQDCTNKYAESEKTIDACGTIESNEDKSRSEEKSKTL